MYKISLVLLLSFIVFSCTTAHSNLPGATLSGVEANKDNISKDDPSPPDWFEKNSSENFDYVLKNAEMSSNKELAELKNIAISEILLANKIEVEFMTINDQIQYIDMIRNADNEVSVKKFMKNKIVTDIVSGYKINANETLKYENGYINYLFISKIKK